MQIREADLTKGPRIWHLYIHTFINVFCIIIFYSPEKKFFFGVFRMKEKKAKIIFFPTPEFFLFFLVRFPPPAFFHRKNRIIRHRRPGVWTEVILNEVILNRVFMSKTGFMIKGVL